MTPDDKSGEASSSYRLKEMDALEDLPFETWEPLFAPPPPAATVPERRDRPSAQARPRRARRTEPVPYQPPPPSGGLNRWHFAAFALAMGGGFWAVTSGALTGGPAADGAALSGLGGNGGSSGIAALSVGNPPPFSVTVQTSTESRRELALVIRGRTEAGARVAIKAEAAGVVEAVTVEKGARVNQGDVLCVLQRGPRDAGLAEAQAQLSRARLNHDENIQLAEGGATAAKPAAGFKAAVDAAEAAVRKAEIELARSQISAPFAGVVEELPARRGALLSAGGTCALLVAPDPLFVVGSVSEREVGRLRPGMEGTAELATGETVSGRIRFVAIAAEASTRTFRVELQVPNRDALLRDGVSATMRIPLDAEPGHRLPPSALTLSDDGRLGVRVVNEGETAQFMPVTILSDERNAVWVGGLPRETRVIVAGQDFVIDGQRVEPIEKGQLAKQ